MGTSAFAMVSMEKISNNLKQQIAQIAPTAELDDLTTRRVAAIDGLFSSSGNFRAGNDPAGRLKVILGWD